MLFASLAACASDAAWNDIVAKARGQVVEFNAWAGDEKINAFIAWVGDEVARRYGVTLRHVKLRDTAEAVTRVIAEKSAGRNSDGSVDLIWLNGPNFLALKEQRLLYGPFATGLPNYRYVDVKHVQSNVVDFTIPVAGFASPWRRAQIVFIYDSRRAAEPPSNLSILAAFSRGSPPAKSSARSHA